MLDSSVPNVGPVGRPRGAVRRWLRRVGLAVLALLVSVTVAALVYDFATAGESRPPGELYSGPIVRVGDTLIAYRRWGTSGSAVILLGGAAEPSWVWHRVGQLLAARGHRVYAIDLPPFGYSQRRGPYTMAHWIALVRGFDRRVEIRRPLIVGHSLGAGVAAAYALASPRQVSGIVLLDGDAVPFGHGIGWFSHLLVFPYFPALFRLATGSDWVASRVLRNAWGAGHPHFGDRILDVFQRPFRVQGTEAALKQLAGGGIPGVPLSDLRGLRVPRAVVWGAHDTVDSLSSGRATAEALRVHIRIIPHAAHLSMLANPQAVALAIERESRIAAPRRT